VALREGIWIEGVLGGWLLGEEVWLVGSVVVGTRRSGVVFLDVLVVVGVVWVLRGLWTGGAVWIASSDYLNEASEGLADGLVFFGGSPKDSHSGFIGGIGRVWRF
jgi:hypothetical protein